MSSLGALIIVLAILMTIIGGETGIRSFFSVLINSLLLVLVAMLVHGLLTNENYRWDVVGQHLFDPRILAGVGWTLLLTVAAMLLGSVAREVSRLAGIPVTLVK